MPLKLPPKQYSLGEFKAGYKPSDLVLSIVRRHKTDTLRETVWFCGLETEMEPDDTSNPGYAIHLFDL